MDVLVVLALIGVALFLAELLLPTGGVLAVLGTAGLVAAGVVALTGNYDSAVHDYVGPALITLGALSLATFFFVGRKVLEAHLDEPVRTGYEELIGATAQVREPLEPEGQIFLEGSLWRARLTDGGRVPVGDRVIVESVDGLTLLVRPADEPERGAA